MISMLNGITTCTAPLLAETMKDPVILLDPILARLVLTFNFLQPRSAVGGLGQFWLFNLNYLSVSKV